MKILNENAGILTNFEVLDFMRSRGAAKDPTRVLAPIKPSEFKVYDYLEKSVACSQTRESIVEFVTKSKTYKLRKHEITSIINIRPSSAEQIYPFIDNFDSRIGDNVEELEELIEEVFPTPPDQSKSDEGNQEAN